MYVPLCLTPFHYPKRIDHRRLSPHLDIRGARNFWAHISPAWSTVPFPSLQSLDIYSPNYQAGRSAVQTLIKCTASTLSSLKISGHCMPSYIAGRMANSFAEHQVRQLKRLSFNIMELSVSFLDLLARNLPQLEKLCLWTFKVVGSSKVCIFPPILSLNLFTPFSDSLLQAA